MPGEGSNGGVEIPDWSNDPGEDLLRSELRDIIQNAIQALPPKYRLVFNLRDLEGFDTEETAEILEITPQAVKTRLHRARLFLRERLSEHYREEKDA
jgi:RNA polymerase sigma-70 factor (ECF subfamily)